MMKQKEVSNIEQNAFTSCLEMEKKVQTILFYPKVNHIVFSFN